MKINRPLRIRSAFVLFAAFALLFTTYAQAKPRAVAGSDADGRVSRNGLFRADETRDPPPSEIEKRFRPYLEEKIGGRHGARGGIRRTERAARPTAKDYILLMKAWSGLSPEFQRLFNEASEIPDGFDSHVSPMGKFRIYYTTEGDDSIYPSDVDTIGYGGGQTSNWRVRRSAPNGVPDYVDEVAFAFDSAWSMIVDRFGFAAPTPDSGEYYRVLVCNMDGYYGMAHPIRRTTQGFTSMIEINSDWSDKDMWGPPLGYDTNPYAAVRVTAAHEFFHAVQYAAAWNVYNYTPYIDDYPEAWLEGSATLMEELAFPDINDYLQYINEYFRNPTQVSFLNDIYDPYMNSLLFKYLYEKTAAHGDSIGFVKSVMDEKKKLRSLEFFKNLEQTSRNYSGKSWAEILNGFHAESYFTGGRARPWAFVSDAGLMRAWSLPVISQGKNDSVVVRPHSVGLFRYAPEEGHADTLYLHISGITDDAAPGRTWAASVLVMERDDSVGVITIPVNANGYGIAEIHDWKDKRECLLVLTNASPILNRLVIVTPSDSATPPPPDNSGKNPKITVLNKAKLRDGKPITISSENGDITEIKVVSANGKFLDGYNNRSGAGASSGGKNSGFKDTADGVVEWYPNRRTVPGVYYLFIDCGGKLHKRKIVVLP